MANGAGAPARSDPHTLLTPSPAATPPQGTADVRASLGGKRYELNVSTYQMCMLLLFNCHDAISFKDLCAELSVPASQLKRHLVSLLVPRVKLLLKERKGKDLLESDVFRVNPDFKSRLTRVRIPLVSLKGGDELKATPESVQEDRRHLYPRPLSLCPSLPSSHAGTLNRCRPPFVPGLRCARSKRPSCAL